MDSANVATLTIRSLDGTSKTVSLADGQSYRIGRLDTADIRLDDASISRIHAMFTVSNTGVVVSDLNSTNGTFVNGKQISIPVDLQAGDVVDIGPFKLSVAMQGAELVDSGARLSGRTMTAQLRPSTAVVVVAKLMGYVAPGMEADDPIVTNVKKHWTSGVTACVQANSGAIDKVLDATIVAVWYGMDAAKAAAQAVQASRAIKAATDSLTESGVWPPGKSSPLRCVTAVNSGLALVGSVGGTSGIRNFAVLGDTINIALRMVETAGYQLEPCVVSDPVASVLGASLAVKKLSTIVSETSGETVTIFAVQ